MVATVGADGLVRHINKDRDHQIMANCFIGNYGPDADQLVCINAVDGIYNVISRAGLW